jgi:hypothetical protein
MGKYSYPILIVVKVLTLHSPIFQVRFLADGCFTPFPSAQF